MRDPDDTATLDLFAPPPKPPRPPRLGDCIYCWGERMCETPEACFPEDEERRL